ncbi:MAG: LamG domain-containing protein [Bacteroidales bacterium]
MKTKKVNFLNVILMMAMTAVLFVGCDKDKTDDVDKAALLAALTTANDLIDDTMEGLAEGQYLPGSKDALMVVIDAAQDVYDDAEATQTEVDNTVISLNAAMEVYEENVVAAIAPDALVGHWTFNEGEGTTLNDYSGNGFNGTLMDGAATWGGSLPEWTTDRYGDADAALMFDDGAHVVIPYNASLNPQKLSISLWLSAAEILENNRFIGLHSWMGYKFQLQSVNKAFFTISTSEGIYDRDTDPPLEIDTWYHVVVTFGDGNMTFYINGEQAQQWDNTPGTAATNTGNDLVFGCDSDEYAADDTNFETDQIIPLAWGGYFHGSMDEVRFYDDVLTSAQVLLIYNLEKVTEE